MLKIIHDKDLKKLLLSALVILLFYCWLSLKFAFFAIPNLNIVNSLFKATHSLKSLPKEAKEIVIVAIDDRSYQLIGKPWPWERSTYAKLIDKISRYQPKVISIDITFVGQGKDQNDDLIFAQSLKNAGNIILSSYFAPKGEYVIPDKIFRDSSLGFGIINKPRDRDLFVRRARPLFFSQNKEILDYSFEIKTICASMGIPLNQIFYAGNEVVLKGSSAGKKDIHIPLRKDLTMPINFLASLRELKVISFWDAVNKDFPAEVFKDKIVLVGAVAEIFHDIYPTPLNIMPGVVVNANEILTIKNNRFIRELLDIYNYLILIAVVVLTILLTYLLSPTKGLFCVILELMVFIGAGFYLFIKDFSFDYFSPVLMILLSYLGTNAYKYVRLLIENAALKTLAITDSLTGLFAPRYFQVRLQSEFERMLRYGINLSLVIIDLDHFKKINDTYGHQQGNVVLRGLADILKNASRKADIVARFGGEEFCVIAPHTNSAGALEFTNRLRKAIEKYDFTSPKGPLKITASFGIASVPQKGINSTQELITCADTALYRAKNTGRNRACVFDPQDR